MTKITDHDAYIAKAPDFAVPILEKIRKLVHKGCPGVQETMKWGTPFFDHEGLLAGMAAFKAHVNLSFWKGTELSDPRGRLDVVGKSCMGSMRIEKLADLPPERELVRMIKEAAKLNEAARSTPKAEKKSQRKDPKKITAPPDLLSALRKKKKALATFEGYSYTHRKEYVDWILEAKREETRKKRVATAVEWMAEGKTRNWKYR